MDEKDIQIYNDPINLIEETRRELMKNIEQKLIDEYSNPNIPEINYINVNGREEHEALLRDDEKMLSLGLDPYFERMVYLKRWGSWLNGNTGFSIAKDINDE